MNASRVYARCVRVALRPNGTIDEVWADAVEVRFTRTGDSRYVVRVRGTEDAEILLWTTRKQQIRLCPLDPAPPAWIVLELADAGELRGLSATACALHVEQMDRASYFVGLSRDDAHFGLHLVTHGYLKARFVRVP